MIVCARRLRLVSLYSEYTMSPRLLCLLAVELGLVLPMVVLASARPAGAGWGVTGTVVQMDDEEERRVQAFAGRTTGRLAGYISPPCSP